MEARLDERGACDFLFSVFRFRGKNVRKKEGRKGSLKNVRCSRPPRLLYQEHARDEYQYVYSLRFPRVTKLFTRSGRHVLDFSFTTIPRGGGFLQNLQNPKYKGSAATRFWIFSYRRDPGEILARKISRKKNTSSHTHTQQHTHNNTRRAH